MTGRATVDVRLFCLWAVCHYCILNYSVGHLSITYIGAEEQPWCNSQGNGLCGLMAELFDGFGHGLNSGHHCQLQPWASCLYTCGSVAKQYNLVPANGRQCHAAGKVTVGLASHSSCVADISGSLPIDSSPGRGWWTPVYTV